MIATTVLKHIFEMKYPKANVTVITVNNQKNNLDNNKMLENIDGYLTIFNDSTIYYILASYSDNALDKIRNYLITNNVRHSESKLTWRLSGYLSMLTDNNNISTNIKLLEDLN